MSESKPLDPRQFYREVYEGTPANHDEYMEFAEAYAAAENEALRRERDELREQVASLTGKLQVLDGALSVQSEFNAVFINVIPTPDSVHGEAKKNWQKVINAVYKCADYADANGLSEARPMLRLIEGRKS